MEETQIPGFYQMAEKTVEYAGDGDTNCSWYASKRGIGGTGNPGVNRGHPDHSTIKISKYT